MSRVSVPKDFGIIIRKHALENHGIDLKTLLQVMEAEKPFDESKDLVSFGPHFGEAVNEFIRRLENLNLVYSDDFVEFSDPSLPDWCNVYIALT